VQDKHPMNSPPLAVVTGGAHRLGKVFTETLAKHGFAVAVHYWSSSEAAEGIVRQLRSGGSTAYALQADLRESASVSALFSRIDSLGHRLQVLVNSAALLRPADVRRLEASDWDETLNLNLRAPFLCAREAAARMWDGGLIVNVSDVGARKHWVRFPAYTVSKAGLESLTGVLARTFAPDIRVNAIAPGLFLPSADMQAPEWTRLVERLPMRRAGTADELAAAFEFLLTNEYVTGHTLVLDGGYSLIA
jgi:NAD(P)-dependent dehydrogenase (short-subunit alcohol dehydrogenase family)